MPGTLKLNPLQLPPVYELNPLAKLPLLKPVPIRYCKIAFPYLLRADTVYPFTSIIKNIVFNIKRVIVLHFF